MFANQSRPLHIYVLYPSIGGGTAPTKVAASQHLPYNLTPAEAGEVPRPALSEYDCWFHTTAYLLEFGEPEAIDRSCPALPEELSPYGPCLDRLMGKERDVARFVCHSLGLQRTSAQGATPESAPLVDWVFPLEEGVSLSILPPEFIHTLFPLYRRTLFQPTLGARGLGSSGVALNWRGAPLLFSGTKSGVGVG